MKKILFALFFVLIFSKISAQGIGEYRVNVDVSYGGFTYTDEEFTVSFSDGSFQDTYDPKAISPDVRLTGVTISVTCHDYYSTNTSGYDQWGAHASVDFPDQDLCNLNVSDYSYDISINGVVVYPILKVRSINNIEEVLPTSSKITIESDSHNFPDDVYQWQYSIHDYVMGNNQERSGWTNVPDAVGKARLEISANDVLNNQGSNYHGKYISFRQISCGGTYKSNYIQLLIKNSLPNVLSVSDVQTTCYDSKDGQIKLQMDRLPNDNEILSLDLLHIETDTHYNIYNLTRSDFTEEGEYESERMLDGGNYILKIVGQVIGESGSSISNTLFEDFEFIVKRPTPVAFTLNETGGNIYCHGGNDGFITIAATGGSGIYQYQIVGESDWLPFQNWTRTRINNLTAGNYKIKVRDSKGCIAKEIVRIPGEPDALGEEIVLEKTLTQPAYPLAIDETPFVLQPTFYTGTNGQITVRVSGGTPIGSTGKYYYTWEDEAGNDISTLASDRLELNTYVNTLSGIGAGTYYFTVYDQNYWGATSKGGCTTASQAIVVEQPEPLAAHLEVVQEISCNNQNQYADPSSDGVLRVIASGGVPFTGFDNNRQPYKYYWKKLQADGSWLDLTDFTTDTATGLNTGTYAVNIEDKNGIRLGVYVNNELETQEDVTYFLDQPELLQVNLSKIDVCDAADGSITTAVSGGVAPYTYQWSNGVTTSSVSQLEEGVYTVLITDSKGCQVQAEQRILPSLKIETSLLQEPSFAGGSNGSIQVNVWDGLAFDDGSYAFTWLDENGNDITHQAQGAVEATDGNYRITLSGVAKGTYKVRIEDARYTPTATWRDCYSVEREIVLDEPDPLRLAFELIRPISCHTDNEFLTEGQESDAILQAHVTGGRPFAPSQNGGVPYKFTWKKQEEDGSWSTLSSFRTATATNLNHGIYAVNVEDSNGIVLGTYVNNILTQKTDSLFTLVQPEKLTMTLTPMDECHDRLGWIDVEVKGGTPPYTFAWNTGVNTQQINELHAGSYTLTVTDSRGCIITAEATILAPVEVVLMDNIEPTFYQGTNGVLTVRMSQGNAFADGSYRYQWKDEDGNTLNTQVVSHATTEYFELELQAIGKGTYTLTVWDDRDYSLDHHACFAVEKQYIVTEPDPIVVEYELVNAISCNLNNIYGHEVDTDQNGIRDEAQDGALRVHVSGGRPFQTGENNNRPYKYTWKKQSEDGSWQELYNFRSEEITQLSVGTYAVNVEDRNGIVLGIYENNVLQQPTDSLYHLEQPQALTLTFEKTDSKCQGDLEGRAKAIVQGGVGPYTYEWSHGATTAEIENLLSMPYYLVVYDSKGCRVEGVVTIEVPEQFKVEEKVEQLQCHNGTTASIALEVSGGVLPYTYQWNTGATSAAIDNLVAGTYTVEVRDALGCGFIKAYTIANPAAFTFSLGEDVTLCEAQTLPLDIAIEDLQATYSWTSTNGFQSTSSVVELKDAGVYTATITTAKGCVASSQIEITRMNVQIGSEFLIATQAYVGEEVMIVNVSQPKGDQTSWLLPAGVEIIDETDDYIKLVFNQVGEYEIGLREHQGDCFQTFYKKVVVEEGAGYGPGDLSKGPLIEECIIAPVPNQGEFTVRVRLAKESPISLRLINYISPQTFYREEFSGSKNYEIPVRVQVAAGLYIMIVETGGQTIRTKIIIL